MNVSALTSTTASVAQSTVATVDVKAAQPSQSEARLTVLPSGDTVQISAEARSLSAQMPPVMPTPSSSPSRTTTRSSSADNPTQSQSTTSPLRLVSREDGTVDGLTTTSAEDVPVTQEGQVILAENSGQTMQQAQEQPSAEQKTSPAQQVEQQAEEEEQTVEEENKNETQIREVESEINGARRDITFLVGRAAVNETARDQLHEKKTELSELMVELFQLESVSQNPLQ
nr:hypothetical protein [uncultured Desulfuromonas sp.]